MAGNKFPGNIRFWVISDFCKIHSVQWVIYVKPKTMLVKFRIRITHKILLRFCFTLRLLQTFCRGSFSDFFPPPEMHRMAIEWIALIEGNTTVSMEETLQMIVDSSGEIKLVEWGPVFIFSLCCECCMACDVILRLWVIQVRVS